MARAPRRHTWHYRIVHHPREGKRAAYSALHEVHATDGVAHSWTAEPITFTNEKKNAQIEIAKALALALTDCLKREPLTVVGDKIIQPKRKS